MATHPTPTDNTAAAEPAVPSFEDALAELERIVAAMESGQMPLQEALEGYRRGMALLRSCQETLGAAERQIRILEAEGLRDFDPTDDRPAVAAKEG